MSQDRNKPLTARSVVLSTLLGTQPPVLPVGVLVQAGELFGISEGTIRTALSRMLAAGEVEADDGAYRLAGRLLDRQARQEQSRAARTTDWDGRWRFAIVTTPNRSASDRAELRATMSALRLAEAREGVWLRPDNLAWDPPGAVTDHCLVATGHPDEDPARLARSLWDLTEWARRARDLREALRRSKPRLGNPKELAAGFVLSAAVLRHFQADPLLPPQLLPKDWPGAGLRDEYQGWDADYRSLLRTWWRTSA